ncbi:hypothetical protein BDR26DRAFT_899031 [Obelidium mucronatum]|nr:hypothetical protein BDR26DRAFT_899031 [Obelidium mucronatum]
MYAYTQYRHESKKWFSRVYLLFANVLLLALAVVVMVSGYAVLKVVTDDENLLTVGSIIAVFSLVGSIGACKRHNGALKFYIFGLIVFFFVILGCGIKFIMELKANSTRWNDMSLESWKNLDNYHKDMYQIQVEFGNRANESLSSNISFIVHMLRI